MKKIYLAVTLLVAFGTSAYALPSLQLGEGSSGGWNYETTTQTWFATGSPFELTAFANATSSDGGNGDYAWDAAGSDDRYAYLVFAAVPDTGSFVDVFDINVENDGGNLSLFASGYGTPPLQDTNDLAPHGIYDTYFEIFEFQFDGALTDIYDTQPGETGTGKGFAENFLITVNSLSVTGIHMDLFSIEGNGMLDLGVYSNSLVNANAPYSHDAEYSPAPVPEPATMLLFGTGLAGLAGARLRRKKK